jgi:GntR family transcriptional regulator
MLKEFSPAKDANTPLYLQLASNIRGHILEGGIVPGNALPSERILCELTGMSRVTVRKSIETLIEEGVLFRKQGSGTYVARHIEAPATALTSFSDDARTRGESSTSIWVVKGLAFPTNEEAAALGVPVTKQVVKLGRIRLSGGVPLAIEHAVVPSHLLPDIESVGESLYEALEKRGNRPVKGTQKVRASVATPTEAGFLGIRENSEVLRIERLTQSIDGTKVEFTRSVYRGDTFEFVSDLKI